MQPKNFPFINRSLLKTLQVNIGYKCNQRCSHCHVNAGPDRTEMMSNKNIEMLVNTFKTNKFSTLDITGGAPEMHPMFKHVIKEAKDQNIEVIDRCNLTILTENGYEDLAAFLTKFKVQIIASLPCYLEKNVDKQRGYGVFKKSIQALKKLNSYGYGIEGTGLTINLVYNPIGACLPPPQSELEITYKKKLYEDYGIHFNKLFTLANMPIKRFADELKRNGSLEDYQSLLISTHNPSNVENVMCKSTLSVNWEGFLYDCDFNQQLSIPIEGRSIHLKDLVDGKDFLTGKPIKVGQHCFGCTAGNGSSCGGALAN